ncbi:MAG TPA: alpha/beta hydrolase [Pyrinomonadaceae bacterium]|nr:alpha/beta hydrolase [Pyrinomonadaceae bacterium]
MAMQLKSNSKGLVLVFLLPLLAVDVLAQQKAGDLNITPRVFESARGEKVDVEFGELTVPENRQKPDSRLIQIAFIRFKSTAKSPAAPIVYLAGGPGGSGIAAARGSRFPLFMAMREIADVIALDQRGVGSSKPNLACKETVSFAPDKLQSRADLLETSRRQSKACAAAFKQQGVDLTGYNTNESADDLEDLRKAIGAKKISLWGISYGTHLSLATIKRHEKSIERVILAGVEGPSQTIKLPSNIQKHLEHIDRLVSADPNLSKDIPSFVNLVKTVLEEAERKPVTVEVTDPNTKQPVKVALNKLAIQLLTAFSFGSGEAALPARYYAMSKGDFSLVAQGWLNVSRARGVGSAMTYMMDCASGLSDERRKQIVREAETTLLGDVMNFPFPGVCDAWGNPDAGAGFRAPVKSGVPALFISGTLDVRTPPSNAEEVRKGFPNSTHLIIEGAVHSDPLFLSSPQIKDVMIEFMKGQRISTTKITLDPLKFVPLKG